MSIFKKTHSALPNSQEPQEQPLIQHTTEQSSTASSNEGKSMEQIARQWWAKHLGGNIPKDIEQWLHELTRIEARRQHLQCALLSSKQEDQAQEGLRLGLARIQHINERISRICRQEEWLDAYKRLQQALKTHNTRLYGISKHLAACIDEEKRLQRFETFEPIQGDFQHLRLLHSMNDINRTRKSQTLHTIEQKSIQHKKIEKPIQELQLHLAEAEKQLETANKHMEVLCRIQGAASALELSIKNTANAIEALRQQQHILNIKAEELRQINSKQEQTLNQHKKQLQALDPHRRMLEVSDSLVLRLNLLAETKAEADFISARLNSFAKKQREKNLILEQLAFDYQRLNAEIKNIKDELQQHRICIAGVTSYELQKRVINESTRHKMLLSANALWNHIQEGYAHLEEMRTRLTAYQHKRDYGQTTLKQLEKEVERLRIACHEKEYTLTVSKSENVIQLRSDLKEGISCTVCGAAHHPYHSDTMLEQNKLISELKAEFQILEKEYQNKSKLLEQLYRNQAACESDIVQTEQFQTQLQKQQDTFVAEWQMYANLDRSFAECSINTNHNARKEMIQLLIQTTMQQSKDAQEELEKYNQHQTKIILLSEQLTKKEQERTDMDIQLNEVNTACHVLARQIEMYELLRQEIQTRHSRYYEAIQEQITLRDWHKDWQNSSEALCQRITQMKEEWMNLQSELNIIQQHRISTDAIINAIAENENFLEKLIQGLNHNNE